MPSIVSFPLVRDHLASYAVRGGDSPTCLGKNSVAANVMLGVPLQGGERFRLWTLIQGKRAGAGERPPLSVIANQ